MTFYENLRDNTAAPLIKQFGQTATYRAFGNTAYDNESGRVLKGNSSDTEITLLDLPIPAREFSADVTARASAMLLVSAETAIVPKVDEEILLGNQCYQILAINTVGPSGVAVIYKMAVQNA